MGRNAGTAVLVHAVLAGVLGVVYFGVVGLGDALDAGAVSGLVAALAAGVLFHPVRLRLRALADRLLKVERDPYRLADRLSQSVQKAGGPAEALASAVTVIRQVLRAEGVAVEVALPDERVRTVADGEVGEEAAVTPLVWHGRPVGRLWVAVERTGPMVVDAALLEMLARQLAEVAHAVRLTADLERSRERMLITREEERRRLRRDLRDGLGPTLAGLAVTVDEARLRLGRDPEAVGPLLHGVRHQMTEAIVDVRDLVYGLRPPGAPGPEATPEADSHTGPRSAAPPHRPAAEPRSSVRRRVVTVLAWSGAVLAPCAHLLGLWLAGESSWATNWLTVDAIPFLFPAAGAFIIMHRPRLLFPWLMWGIGMVEGAYTLSVGAVHWLADFAPGPYLPYVAWLSTWLWLWYVVPVAGIMPLLFPDGRLPSRRWRPVLWATIALTVGHSLLMGLVSDLEFEIDLPIRNPFGVEALGTLPQAVERVIGLPMLVLCALGVLSLGARYRAAGPQARRQIAWYGYTMVAFAVLWVIRGDNTMLLALQVIVSGAMPIAIMASVLRHRLYGLEVILNRTLVYGTLALVVGVTYSALLWAGDRLAGGYGPVAGLAAALVAGAVFHPVRLRLQQSVDQLFKLERDPYRAADRLSRTVQEAGDPAEALMTATSMVRWALGARGAGVEIHGEVEIRGEVVLTFVDGELGPEPRAVPLAWHGEPVGRLLLAGARPGREQLSVLAKHLAELARAVQLSADLRRSRERIRATREEERRRLGRELHDGLGPTLTSVTMTLDEARRRLDLEPAEVAELLVRVREEMTATVESVRELVHGLRPPVLDDLGLEGALRQLAQAPGPRVDVVVEGPLDGLPAAVEVAAYRIAQEALTNVRRHARATTALVRLDRWAGELRVSVSDDGVGLPVRPDWGVGLTSMRERSAETGGTCVVGPGAGGGTEMIARLPL